MYNSDRSVLLVGWLELRLDHEGSSVCDQRSLRTVRNLFTSQRTKCCVPPRSTSRHQESVGLSYRRVGVLGISKMPASIVDAKPDEFEAILKAAEEKGPGLLLVLFLGDLVATTGQSWCPDCVKAESIINQQVNEADKPVTLVRVFVGDKATWRTPEHRLRRDKRLKLKGVPTLIRWENGSIAGRLEDFEADDDKKIKRLMKIGTRSRAGSMSSSTSQSVSSSPRSKLNSYAG